MYIYIYVYIVVETHWHKSPGQHQNPAQLGPASKLSPRSHMLMPLATSFTGHTILHCRIQSIESSIWPAYRRLCFDGFRFMIGPRSGCWM